MPGDGSGPPARRTGIGGSAAESRGSQTREQRADELAFVVGSVAGGCDEREHDADHQAGAELGAPIAEVGGDRGGDRADQFGRLGELEGDGEVVRARTARFSILDRKVRLCS
mgnify:CR=1 FL=1